MNAVEDAAHSAAARAYFAKFMVVLRIDGIYGEGIEIYCNNNDVFSVGSAWLFGTSPFFLGAKALALAFRRRQWCQFVTSRCW